MLLVSEKGECDWVDTACKTWDSVSCTCNDSDYVSKSGPREDPADKSSDKLSDLSPTISTRSTKHIGGFYSDKVRNNWIAVDNDAYKKAKQQIYNQLSKDPHVSYGQVDNLSKNFKTKGQSWVWTGKVQKKKKKTF
jgi:hypothetical protein